MAEMEETKTGDSTAQGLDAKTQAGAAGQGSAGTVGEIGRGTDRAMVVAIDGPAGAGKSTVAAALAKEFGLLNLETGAMYRALALKCLRGGTAVDDAAAVEAVTAETRLELEPGETGNRVLLDGREVTPELRKAEVTAAASRVSVHPKVRAWMVAEQRAMGLRAAGGVVMEGRDIGTVVFPDASVKLFLDASVEARGERRYQQQGKAAAQTETREEITREIAERDGRDRSRAASPLRPAEDAIVIDTTGMALEEVVARATELVRTHAARVTGATVEQVGLDS